MDSGKEKTKLLYVTDIEMDFFNALYKSVPASSSARMRIEEQELIKLLAAITNDIKAVMDRLMTAEILSSSRDDFDQEYFWLVNAGNIHFEKIKRRQTVVLSKEQLDFFEKIRALRAIYQKAGRIYSVIGISKVEAKNKWHHFFKKNGMILKVGKDCLVPARGFEKYVFDAVEKVNVKGGKEAVLKKKKIKKQTDDYLSLVRELARRKRIRAEEYQEKQARLKELEKAKDQAARKIQESLAQGKSIDTDRYNLAIGALEEFKITNDMDTLYKVLESYEIVIADSRDQYVYMPTLQVKAGPPEGKEDSENGHQAVFEDFAIADADFNEEKLRQLVSASQFQRLKHKELFVFVAGLYFSQRNFVTQELFQRVLLFTQVSKDTFDSVLYKYSTKFENERYFSKRPVSKEELEKYKGMRSKNICELNDKGFEFYQEIKTKLLS